MTSSLCNLFRWNSAKDGCLADNVVARSDIITVSLFHHYGLSLPSSRSLRWPEVGSGLCSLASLAGSR